MEIRIEQIIFQVINFAIILFVLKKFLYAPILRILDERIAKVKEGQEAAERNIKMAKKLDEDKSKALASAKKDAQDLVKEAQFEADRIVKEARAKAKAEAQTAVEKERQAFEDLMKQRTQEFEQKMAALVAKATKAVVADMISADVKKDVIDKQIKNLSL